MVHKSVMFSEVMQIIAPEKGLRVLDCTFGRGGHSRGLADRGATVVAIDRDPEAILWAEENPISGVEVLHAKFSDIGKKFAGQKFDAILFDLGLSSPQIDNAERGMSFKLDGPLSMCMGLNELSARDFVNQATEEMLAEVIFKYGEERASRRIAKEIIKYRKTKPIERTGELAEIVRKVVSFRGKIDPATRTFQAIRIFVNNELEELSSGLEQAYTILKEGGIICCISFHSLEDRIVKFFFKKLNPKRNLIQASEEEVKANSRARSAKLRWYRRCQQN